MTPGPIGINSATSIGYTAPGAAGFDGWWWGVLGSILCTLVVMIPSFVLVSRLNHYIIRHRDSEYVKGIFLGLRPVVVGLIASAALLLMNNENFGTETYDIVASIIICVASFCVVFFTKIHPIWAIVAAGIAGLFIF